MAAKKLDPSRGEPGEGQMVQFNVRVPQALVDEIGVWLEEVNAGQRFRKRTRSDLVRDALIWLVENRPDIDTHAFEAAARVHAEAMAEARAWIRANGIEPPSEGPLALQEALAEDRLRRMKLEMEEAEPPPGGRRPSIIKPLPGKK